MTAGRDRDSDLAAANANAWAALTGQRLRTLPLTGTQNVSDNVFADGFE